jgi:tetratricopeptide (TPR) repeat protein
VRVQLSTAIVAVAISSALGVASARAQDQPAQQQSQQTPQAQPGQPGQPAGTWKDRAEYDVVQAALKETDPKKKLELLNQWKEKYPNTDFKEMRLEAYLDAYQGLKDPAQLLASAKELLALNPKNLKGLYWVNLLAVSMNQTSPEMLDLADKSANGLLNAEKPAGTTDEAWKANKPQMEILGHRTLGWVSMQRKAYPEAEKELAAELKMNPADAEASYWLGTVILAQKKPERQSEALYYFARAAAYDGQGALDPARRKQIEAYVEKAYTTYHGKDPQGFQQLLQMAKTSAFPPADFKILSEGEVSEHKEQQLAASNPSLAFWVKLKTALTAQDGMQYFDSGMKNAMIPPEGQPALTGTVISQEPARNPKVVVLGVESPTTPEVTLRFETPLAGSAQPGQQIQFRGVASSFTQQPFMVTFDTERKNITGWPTPAPAAKKAPVRKKKAE